MEYQSLLEFDPDSGETIPESQEAVLIEDLKIVINQAESFKTMLRTEGWILVEKFIKSQSESLVQKLKVEKDFNEIVRFQSEILAFESILGIIKKSFSDAEYAKQELFRIQNENSEPVLTDNPE